MTLSANSIDEKLLNAAIRLNTTLLCIVCGFLSGSLVFLVTILSLLKLGDHPGQYLNLLGIFFTGYTVSVSGAFIGFLWGFVAGGLAGGLLYWTYAKALGKNIAAVFSSGDQDNIFSKPQILRIAGHPLGLAFGGVMASMLVVSTNILVLRGTADESIHAALLSNYLPGYTVSFVGSLIGCAELFFLSYLVCLLFGFIYNFITRLRYKNFASLVNYASPAKKPQALDPSKHVCILGAGPAGLATGHELSLNQTKVTILEKNDYVSGLCRTVFAHGYRFDLGGHRWFTQNESLNNWFRRLMKGELVLVKRISRIYYGGKYFNYPLSVGDVVKKAGPLTMLTAGIAYISAIIKYGVFGKPVTNMKEAYTKQFGSKLYEMFFKVYSEKVWGHSCEELSADWVTQRSKGLNIITIVREAIANSRKTVVSLVDEFMYPRLGYSRICERMADDIRKSGAKIALESAVNKIIYRGPRDFEIQYQNDGKQISVYADSIVSTIPLGLLAQMIEPGCDNKVINAAKGMEFRDLITVNLMLNCKQVSTDTWLYLQDRELIFGRLHEPKNWSLDMVPDEQHTSLVLEVFCSVGDSLWQMSNDELGQRCVDNLADKLDFINSDDVEGWTVIRTRHAYPVYDMQYSENIAIVNEFLNQFEGLHIAGRGGSFRYNNADHSIEMGLLLGRKLLGDPIDHMAVNTEATYHEERNLDGPQRDSYKQADVA